MFLCFTREGQEAIGGTGRIVPMVPHGNRRRQSGEPEELSLWFHIGTAGGNRRGTGRIVPMVPHGNGRRQSTGGPGEPSPWFQTGTAGGGNQREPSPWFPICDSIIIHIRKLGQGTCPPGPVEIISGEDKDNPRLQ